MTSPIRVSLVALLALLSGCASWVAPLSTAPMDGNHGTRTLGSQIEDHAIERKVTINLLRANPSLADARVVVVSWNGQVLLAGQVPSTDMRQQAEGVARSIRHVLHVHNELETGAPISRLARASDAWITTRVKLRLLLGPDVPGRRVKVVTENGVVYLMGLLSRDEAELAVAAARGVYGVQKIVKIFEYIDAKNVPGSTPPG